MLSAEVLEQVVSDSGEPVVLTDERFEVRYVNAAAERALGRRRAEVVGRALPDFVPGVYGNGAPSAANGWRLAAVTGGWAAFGQGGGMPVLEDGWLQRMVEAEQLAAVGQLAASVAHEIGAPLTAISVAVEILLKRECGACTVGHDLEVILTQTRRIAQLSRRLVDLARPGEPVLRVVDLNSVVREAYELLEKQLRRAGIEPTLRLDAELPPVKADAHQIQQVLLNLVLNAQRAIGERQGKVDVVTRRRPRSVELLVSDSGPGIAPEDLAKIFLPFFSRSGGTGLGLPLARQIVHKHGGSIDVESAPGAGATFTVRLPMDSHD